MRTTWRPTEPELAEYARGPVTYEVEMLAKQLQELSSTPGRGEGGTPLENALIEAILIHVRLLDDFLGSEQQTKSPTPTDRDDVFARHWLPGWQPSRFLTEQQMADINAQLAHLAARRQHLNFHWRLDELAAACATRFEEFCQALEAANPPRAAAFSQARTYAAGIRPPVPRRP